MARKWSREMILRELLTREAAGQPLSHGGDDGVSEALYQAGTRIFGSWGNAIRAVGLAEQRGHGRERWPPGRILSIIRSLARRRRPLGRGELRERYGYYILTAARRHFGSWSNAIVAAGVDPDRLRRVPTWTRERILEAILTRALKNEPLGSRTVEPRNLADSAAKVFGTWAAALVAAGVDPTRHGCRPSPASRSPVAGVNPGNAEFATVTPTIAPTCSPVDTRDAPVVSPRGSGWSEQRVVEAVRERFAAGLAMNASAIYHEDRPLYSAALRKFRSWSAVLIAAGLGDGEAKRIEWDNSGLTAQ